MVTHIRKRLAISPIKQPEPRDQEIIGDVFQSPSTDLLIVILSPIVKPTSPANEIARPNGHKTRSIPNIATGNRTIACSFLV